MDVTTASPATYHHAQAPDELYLMVLTKHLQPVKRSCCFFKLKKKGKGKGKKDFTGIKIQNCKIEYYKTFKNKPQKWRFDVLTVH